jgi:hypothetical protein
LAGAPPSFGLCRHLHVLDGGGFRGSFFPTLPFISIPWRGEQGFEDLLRTEGRKTATRDDFISWESISNLSNWMRLVRRRSRVIAHLN